MLTDLISYDLKVAALIAVFYLFYILLLARETTHSLNRAVLLSAIALSAVLPLCIITIHSEPHPQPLSDGRGEYIDMLTDVPQALSATEVTTPISMGEWLGVRLLGVLLLAGILIRLLYVARGYWKLHRLIRTGEQHTLPTGTRVCVVDTPVAPFSWMQTIVLSHPDWNAGFPPILAHEEAHVRHYHSYDVVVVEVLTALQWFNPVVWFLRQELRTLHEYEADASVLSHGFDESQYIHLLMQKATGIQACALANGINTHRTKKRIIMMLKPKSNRTAWLKALYVVPVALVSLAMTAKTVVDYETATNGDNESSQSLAVRVFTENTNGRGDSYQIRHTPNVKFYHNGKEEAIPGDRSIALEVKSTTMKLNGVEFDENSLPNVPISALHEIHLDESTPDHFVANLVTDEPIKYSSKISDKDFVNYVKQQKIAGLTQSALSQIMLNEAGYISRAHILHLNGVYGSKKGNLLIVDGKEVSREDFNEIKPEAIASVTVMDVGPAKKVYGEKGRYGATIVETKQVATDATPQKEEGVFDICEQMPSFPGGDAKLWEFVARNIKYPKVATDNGVQGRVLVQFIVEKDGSLSNAKVLDSPKTAGTNMVVVTAMMPDKERQDAEAHNAGVQALHDEAIRVVNAMPKWTPGKQNGNIVRCNFVIPVTYRLQ